MPDRVYGRRQRSGISSTTKDRRDRGLSIEKQLAVRLTPLTELKFYNRNPRLHPRSQIRQIAHSIETFGFVVPALVDARGNIIAGHGRIAAAELLGWTEVPTISLHHLTESQAKAFMLADNRLTENSTWDDRLVAEHLKELSLAELDFNLEVTGFNMAEIDLRIEGLTEQSEDDPADSLPQPRSESTVSRRGDLWLLGRHRVHCASALDKASYEILMQTAKAAMVFTDPPYNLAIEGNVSGLGATHHREFAMASGEMDEAEYTAFLTRACANLAANTTQGALHFIFMDWRHIGELLAASRNIYTELKSLCVWVKNHTGMGALYRSRHELIFVFKRGGAPHRNNVMLGRFGRDRTNVWLYPGPRTPSEEGNLLEWHPTVKPARLVADAILDCTARGDIVLDAFLGSGTTVIAAERTARRCYGLEIDPLYVDTIVRRWQAYTGGEACHASSGRSFSEFEAEREKEARTDY
jgi:DNA modification methylase